MTVDQLGELHRQHTEYIDRPLLARLVKRFRDIREATTRMAAPLASEDTVIQTMPDVSPTKWHLGHTSWFFEQFLLTDGPSAKQYQPFHERFAYLFNSYYVSVGDRHCRIKRGTISRPTLDEVYAYRRHVDDAVVEHLESLSDDELTEILPIMEVGFNHEQQHQELAYTDIKHVFACNPLYPTYREVQADVAKPVQPTQFIPFTGGIHEIGHSGDGFAYDNELPRHKTYLQPFDLADRLVTNGEFMEFLDAGGYDEPRLWLSEGWSFVCGDRTTNGQPFYWHRNDAGGWSEFTLNGLVPLEANRPVSHLNYFEADAYARWRGCRLPTEAEWEVAVDADASGSFLESGRLHPAPDIGGTGIRQAVGEVWQWTSSQYSAYPGYSPPAGALGEYNGKFMCNQFVLRGSSCLTPRSHARTTYRNFFPPDARWQMTGLRLARDAS
jgi:ergothioneine biosynthesis protein EgtB